jgi:hypothetical protein
MIERAFDTFAALLAGWTRALLKTCLSAASRPVTETAVDGAA